MTTWKQNVLEDVHTDVAPQIIHRFQLFTRCSQIVGQLCCSLLLSFGACFDDGRQLLVTSSGETISLFLFVEHFSRQLPGLPQYRREFPPHNKCTIRNRGVLILNVAIGIIDKLTEVDVCLCFGRAWRTGEIAGVGKGREGEKLEARE